MYRFQISAYTQTGDSICLVGSTAELGQWDIKRAIRLHTNAACYPLWWTEPDIHLPSLESAERQIVEYKYLRLGVNGNVVWEAIDSNRWLPTDASQPSRIVVDDGLFGYGQPYPFGYLEAVPGNPHQPAELPLPTASGDAPPGTAGLKIAVIGSSVAEGYKAWLFKGWVWRLKQFLQQQYGHRLVNLSELGATVSRTIERFPTVVAPEQPDIVIIALSLGNEGLASCAVHERRAVQRRFESGLQQLVKMTRAIGAIPILGGVYPHNDYTPDHQWLLWDSHQRMMTWGVPVLDWLAALDNGQGRWKPGISSDPAHPNTIGHRLMYHAIDLTLFQPDRDQLSRAKQGAQRTHLPIYLDPAGFQILACREEQQLRIVNQSPHAYRIAPYWQELQTALQQQAGFLPGIYIAQQAQPGMPTSFAVRENGSIETVLEIPPGADLEYSSAFNLFAPNNSNVLFYDGSLGILKQDDQHICIVNETDHEYNIQPMWQEVRSALKAMPPGVYDDPLNPDAPFRTLMIGPDGSESRLKAPARSALLLSYKCKLSDINRVAIIPLGDRCAVRMMLYKMEYDGPAFPFDLTRTTQISDVADIIESRFHDMWNPAYLHYDPDAGRIYHTKWTGLSFAHEVDESDDPTNDMSPVYKRMYTRYKARSDRFWYTIQHCDKVLFVRTGITNRGGVIDLVNKLTYHCHGKPFHLLLLSPQSSDQFLDLANVQHYDFEFNADRMYEDLGHWLYCTEVMRGILQSLGISSQNLFWCPPNLPRTAQTAR